MISKAATFVAATFILVLFAACADGGGGPGTEVHSSGPVPEQGGQTQPQHLERQTNTSSVTVSLEQMTDNPTAGQVVEYLYSQLSGGPWSSGIGSNFSYEHDPGLARFETPPIVRIAQGTDDHYRVMIHHAVAIINLHLPYAAHIQIGSDAPTLVFIDDVPDGQIFVDFAPPSDWNAQGGGRPGAEAGADISDVKEWDPVQRRWEKKEMRASRVWMSTETGFSDPLLISILMHELLHALGLPGHVPAGQFPTSLMRDSVLLITHQIPEIDGASLRAVYTRYDNGTEPEDVSATSLGPWASTSTNLFGEIDTVDGTIQFGVNDYNGVSVPWTSGSEPNSALVDNYALTGTVTWNGGLLGFTPDSQSVGGDAEISVNMGTMTGSADFTDLQSWAAGQTPGALGTGAQWNDGALSYSVSVSGNYMYNNGGDDGVLSANFVGENHQGVAGSLERHDLTAAFGAKR